MSHLVCENEVGTGEVLEASVMLSVVDAVKKELSTPKGMSSSSYGFDGPW